MLAVSVLLLPRQHYCLLRSVLAADSVRYLRQERRNQLAEVSEIIRVVTATGELIIRLTDAVLRRDGLVSGLISHAIRDRGGGGAQTPAALLDSAAETRRALEVPTERLADVRNIARKAGVKFSAVESPNEGRSIVYVADKDQRLLKDIARIMGGEEPDSAAVQQETGKDAGLAEFSEGTSFRICALSPEDAVRFREASAGEALAVASTDRLDGLMSCLRDNEISFQYVDSYMHEGTEQTVEAWNIVSSGAAAAAEVTQEQFDAFVLAYPDTPVAHTKIQDGKVLVAVPFADRANLQSAAGDSTVREVVYESELKERLRSAPREAVHVLVPDFEEKRTREIMAKYGIEGAWSKDSAALVVASRRSLRSWLLAARSAWRDDAVEHACTLTQGSAQTFRNAASRLGLSVREETTGSNVRFLVPKAASARANAILAECGIRNSFRTAKEAGISR